MGRQKSKHRSSKSASSAAILTLGALVGAIVFVPISNSPGFTSEPTNTSRTYSFDTANELTSQFTSTGVTTEVSQPLTGGIANSGAVLIANADSVSTNAVFKAKDGYSLGPVGSKYTFDGYFKSKGLNGWGGMGFTTQNTVVTTGTPEGITRPNDAIGISIAGGGFRFHWPNQVGENLTAWAGAVPTGQIASSCDNPVHRDQTTIAVGSWWTYDTSIACASAAGWYKLTLEIERTGNREFKLRAKLFASDAAGVLRDEIPATENVLDPLADRWVVFTVPDDSPFITQSQMFSYFNLSGQRFEKFDGYGVALSGGATVVQAGYPVVQTVSKSITSQVVTLNGDVTNENGTNVSERGFVYATTPSPTTANTKIVSGSRSGTFTANTPTLAAGTYYFRSYATNGTGTSYGAELSQEIIVAPSQPGTPMATAGDQSASISWQPSATGTAPITYSVETIPSGGTCVVSSSGTGTTASCTGLTNGAEYQFRVTASNGPSSQATSEISTSVTPKVPTTRSEPAVSPVVKPETPQAQDVQISSSGESLRVSRAPAAPENVTRHRITLSPGGRSCELAATESFCTITGAKQGVEYKVLATASNAAGTSKAVTLNKRVILAPSGWLRATGKLSVSNFVGNSSELLPRHKSKLRKLNDVKTTARHTTCTGFAAGPAASERIFALASDRAKAVCKKMSAQTGATFSTSAKVPGLKFAGANRKVLVRVYSELN